ncbi:MAG: hypothetical protein IPL27_22545 [Lewinellaceae bacterium]|nr:hypothetical protein [Lewinellaceae bacterium]
MNKKVSFIWSLGTGLMFVVLSLMSFLSGLGGSSADISLVEYVIIFLTGTLIGAVLVYLLRRSESPAVFKVTWIAFVVSLPFAMFGIIFGGIVGGVGIVLLGVSPAVFIIGVGHYLGRAFASKK